MSPAKAQLALQQALQQHNAGKLAQAAAGYAQIRAALPQSFEAHHLGGAAALQLGKFEEAITLLNRATQLRSSSGSTFMVLGLAFANLGRQDDAEKALRSAVRLEPKNHEAWFNLGSGLLAARKVNEAITAFEKCVQVNPRYANAWSGLGGALQNAQRFSEAIDAQTKALALDPKHPRAQSLRAQVFQNLHEVEKSLSDFESHLARHPDDLEAASFRLFLLNYDARLNASKIFEEHAAYGQRVARLRPAVNPTASSSSEKVADSSRRLRIAFLSPDLREHSVARFIEPLLRHLDREQFHVTLYHDHFVEDAGSERLAKHADTWRNFFGQAASVVEKSIRQDHIDVLVDLAGHTGFNRLSSFQPRLAPTQITYLGYPNTTGLPSMDFRLTDEVADPSATADALHTEKLVRFAKTAWAFQPPANSPEVAPGGPNSRGEPFTFGSFNSLSKINSFTLKLWAEILESVPGSRLLLKGFQANPSAVRERLSQAGIDSTRVILSPYVADVNSHLETFAQVDVALDPWPYNGTTTTCETLWMGVPMVTLAGDRHAARVGASLLHAVGHPEWIAYSPEDYVRIATDFAKEPGKLIDLRGSLRAAMETSPLLDHVGQAKRFSDAIVACTQRNRTV